MLFPARFFVPLAGLLSLASFVACSSSDEPAEDGVDEGALATGVYDADLAKAHSRLTVEHDKGDFCVALRGIPGAAYSESDLKKEKKLCAADFHKSAETASDQKAVVLCPKVVSTNPGVDVYELPEGKTKAELQDDAICKDTSGSGALSKLDKVGKYKQSLWCSHSGAIIGAYHLSRAIGGAVGVPAAVLRTMDKASHRAIVDQGARITRAKYSGGQFIKRNWNDLWPCLHAGSRNCGEPGTSSANLYMRGPRLWDDDVELSGYASGHLVGAFMGNASEDGTYPGLTTAESVKRHASYVALGREGNRLEKAFTKDTVQGLQTMKDISEFLILDTILEQQDRFSDTGSNMSKKNYLTWRTESGEIKLERADEKKDAPDTALAVTKMVIEDNDCGLRKGMRAKHYDALIAPVRHLAPAAYTGLQELAKNIEGQREMFTNGMAMTTREFDRVVENVKFVASGFAQKCERGELELDLDIATYVAGGAPPACR